MRIKILKTDERLRVKAGEVYEAKRYKYDPQCKYELIGRVGDGYDPECNQYIEGVATEIRGQWMVVGTNGAFEPEGAEALSVDMGALEDAATCEHGFLVGCPTC